MAQQVACPQCHRALEVPDQTAGRIVRCPACEFTFLTAATTTTEITAAPPRTSVPSKLFESSDGTDDDFPQSIVSPSLDRFRSGATLSVAARVLLAVQLLFSLGFCFNNAVEFELAQRMARGENPLLAEWEANDARRLTLWALQVLALSATVTVFLLWFHRVHANLEPLGAPYLAYSSGWAVGAWFVPIVNLFRPVQIAQEIWRNSDPEAIPDRWNQELEGGNSTLVGVWWAAWLIAGVVQNIAAQVFFNATTPQQVQAASVLGLIGETIVSVAGLLAIAVVTRINTRQEARFQALRRMQDE